MSDQLLWPIETQLHHPTVTELALSPDGRQLVFAMEEPVIRDDESKFVTQLHLVGADGARRQLTYGAHSNRTPQWSPDGQYLAFISDRSGKPNLYVMRTDGGEAWALTSFDKSAVGNPVWSPDGQRLAFLMTPPDEAKEKAGKQKDDAIRWDVDFDFAHIYLIDFAPGNQKAPEAIQLTAGRFHVINVAWLAGGAGLALCHMPNPEANQWPETRLATVPASRKAEDSPLGADDLQDLDLLASWNPEILVTPAGQIITSKGDLPARWAFSTQLAVYSPAGGSPQLLARTPDEQPNIIGHSADGQEIYVAEEDGVATQLFAVPLDGGPARPLLTERTVAQPVAANKAGQLAAITQWFHTPPTPALWDEGTGRLTPLSDPITPPNWPDAPLPRAEIIHWPSSDGLEIEGILVYPYDYQEGDAVPLILDIHGGPTGFFAAAYLPSHNRYADAVGLAERGFATLRANPRGSSGYGRDFRFANYNDWGGMDYQDLMAGVDHLISQGIADPERLGVLGWSYGGFMTSSVITQTNRFKAACVGAGVTNFMSFNGTADIPGFIPDYMDAEFWDDLEPYQEHSPLFNIRGVKTPTLVQHGEKDIRVPLSQGRELYNALKRQGIPTELIIYPRQGHGVAEPRLRADVKRRATAWFERWILGKE
ncbi:MAG: S9 family peptidase [Anaerolineales bacterium]|nr:S9 family peptidase [Anaerolineales bacterium]